MKFVFVFIALFVGCHAEIKTTCKDIKDQWTPPDGSCLNCEDGSVIVQFTSVDCTDLKESWTKDCCGHNARDEATIGVSRHLPSLQEYLATVPGDLQPGEYTIGTDFYITYDGREAYYNGKLVAVSVLGQALGQSYTEETVLAGANLKYSHITYVTALNGTDFVVAQTDLSKYKTPYIDGATHYTLSLSATSWKIIYNANNDDAHTILGGSRTCAKLHGGTLAGDAMIEFPVPKQGYPSVGARVVDDQGKGIVAFDTNAVMCGSGDDVPVEDEDKEEEY